MLNIIYAGTPEFAVPALESLIASDHRVVAVYTQPDRPAGRFLLQAGMSTLALGVAWMVLRETRPLRVRFDVLGAIALAVGVGGFMVALGGVRSISAR